MEDARTVRDGQDRRGWPWWTWAVYVALVGFSVPWYVPRGGAVRLWLGLPHWVVLSLAASLGIALFTAWVVGRHWPSDSRGGDDGEERR